MRKRGTSRGGRCFGGGAHVWYGVGCLGLVLVGLLWHKVTCLLFVHMCSPISLSRMVRVVLNLDRMPTAARSRSAEAALAYAGAPLAACEPARAGAGGAEEPRWALLLASPKSGSTFVQQMLNSHKAIWFGRERILDAYRACRTRAEGRCSWEETRASIEEVFLGYREEDWYSRKDVVGFKIQYEHIPPEVRPEFAAWLACNDVAVLHLSRGAVVESFWTMQAQVLDAMQLKGKEEQLQVSGEKGLDVKVADLDSNKESIPLDPARASEYVRAVEADRADYRQLLVHGPSRVAYQELFYEQLAEGEEEVGEAEWAAALAFLGLEGDLGGQVAALRSQAVRVHPGTCADKISNWDAVRKALAGTDTLVACDAQVARIALSAAAASSATVPESADGASP